MKNNKTKTNEQLRTQQFRVLSVMGLILLLMVLALFIPMISGAGSNKAMAQIKANVGVNSTTSIGEDYIEASATGTAETSTSPEENYDGPLKVNILGVPVTSSAQVSSNFDLEVFSENIVAENENISKVEVDTEDNEKEPEVVVFYKQRGKLLWFIPVTIKSKTEVSALENESLKVESRLSWWGFLVANRDYKKTELESQISNNIVIKDNLELGASAETKARIVEEVIYEIEAHARAQASIES